jgi:hypothetical protein
MLDFTLDEINIKREVVKDDSVLKDGELSNFTLNQVETSINKEMNQFINERKVNEYNNTESEEHSAINEAFMEEKNEGIVFK